MTFLYFFAMAIFLFLALILCLTILIQEGKGGGLGTTFGGGGGGDTGDSLFGTATPEILKKFTGWCAVAFMCSCLILSFWTGSLARQGMNDYATHEIEEIQ